MRARCSNPNNKFYPSYGGRGIRVCARWSSFTNFYEDMGPRPSDGHAIERRDNGGNYEPSNCFWAQARNRRSTRWVIFRGACMSLAEASELAGIRQNLIGLRLWRGWSLSRAFGGEDVRDDKGTAAAT